MNESETRADHIDPALPAAGWGVVGGSRIRREYQITNGRIEGHGRRGKPVVADYVLIFRNTKLAVVEAMAWDEALIEGVAQAKDYAAKFAVRFTYPSDLSEDATQLVLNVMAVKVSGTNSPKIIGKLP